jgi:hypothetical protein
VRAVPSRDLSVASYRNLAEFRHQIRKFLRYSEDSARAHGIEPQQHQLLLAIKGLPAGKLPTISELADRLQIPHHITAEGERMLHELSVQHQTELRRTGPELMRALENLLHGKD